jgi:hypothetical protein
MEEFTKEDIEIAMYYEKDKMNSYNSIIGNDLNT